MAARKSSRSRACRTLSSTRGDRGRARDVAQQRDLAEALARAHRRELATVVGRLEPAALDDVEAVAELADSARRRSPAGTSMRVSLPARLSSNGRASGANSGTPREQRDALGLGHGAVELAQPGHARAARSPTIGTERMTSPQRRPGPAISNGMHERAERHRADQPALQGAEDAPHHGVGREPLQDREALTSTTGLAAPMIAIAMNAATAVGQIEMSSSGSGPEHDAPPEVGGEPVAGRPGRSRGSRRRWRRRRAPSPASRAPTAPRSVMSKAMATTNTTMAPATTVCAQYVVTTSRRSAVRQITRKPSRASWRKRASSSAAVSSPRLGADVRPGDRHGGVGRRQGRMPDTMMADSTKVGALSGEDAWRRRRRRAGTRRSPGPRRTRGSPPCWPRRWRPSAPPGRRPATGSAPSGRAGTPSRRWGTASRARRRRPPGRRPATTIAAAPTSTNRARSQPIITVRRGYWSAIAAANGARTAISASRLVAQMPTAEAPPIP